jgi:A/G-specific adenine glycosylase
VREAWSGLGYYARARNLQRLARTIVRDREPSAIPREPDALRKLPGIGAYTAGAIASFAYERRAPLVDTNVARVLTRVFAPHVNPRTHKGHKVTWEIARAVLPRTGAATYVHNQALMELGALVCTATKPRCDACPVADRCAWRAAGYPAYDGPPRKAQTWVGTDRQCRGRLLAVLRDAEGAVPRERLDRAWDDKHQRDRCLASLLTDGLLVRVPEGYALPG